MDSIKIHKNDRHRIRENMKNNRGFDKDMMTPPKSIRNAVYYTVRRWEKKFGYDLKGNEHETEPMLRQITQEFHENAEKYCGGTYFAKKQTRFDKMKLKEETGFKLQEMPIRKKFRKADQIIATLLKKQAMFALMRCKWTIISNSVHTCFYQFP